jgi:hypothetical protein
MLNAMAETDPSIDNSERIAELNASLETLGPEYDKEKAIFDKANKALTDILDAQEKRRVAEENARRQAEIAEAEAAATR